MTNVELDLEGDCPHGLPGGNACTVCEWPTLSYPELYGHILMALEQLAYHAGFRPTIWIRGTHVQWTCISVGNQDLNIDDEIDMKALVLWARAWSEKWDWNDDPDFETIKNMIE